MINKKNVLYTLFIICISFIFCINNVQANNQSSYGTEENKYGAQSYGVDTKDAIVISMQGSKLIMNSKYDDIYETGFALYVNGRLTETNIYSGYDLNSLLLDGGYYIYVGADFYSVGSIKSNTITFSASSEVEDETYNNYSSSVVSCGDGMIDNIPSLIPKVIRIAYIIIQVLVPVVLVITGMMDLFKGITAQKEEEIKKGQKAFVKRLISAALVFFVLTIVKLIISFAADNSSAKIMDCASCFLENNCESDTI